MVIKLLLIQHYYFYRKVCKEELRGADLYDIKGLLYISIFVITMGFIISIINQFLVIKYIVIIFMIITLVKQRNLVLNFLNDIVR